MIADGTYDVIVVDAREIDDGSTQLELAITSGQHRGQLLVVMARGVTRTSIDLLGTPATLVVADGSPRVILE